MLVEKFLVLEEYPEQAVQMHARHHRHERESRKRFQGHPRFPVEDGQRPGGGHQWGKQTALRSSRYREEVSSWMASSQKHRTEASFPLVVTRFEE